jgi:hypothetical protein
MLNSVYTRFSDIPVLAHRQCATHSNICWREEESGDESQNLHGNTVSAARLCDASVQSVIPLCDEAVQDIDLQVHPCLKVIDMVLNRGGNVLAVFQRFGQEVVVCYYCIDRFQLGFPKFEQEVRSFQTPVRRSFGEDHFRVLGVDSYRHTVHDCRTVEKRIGPICLFLRRTKVRPKA